MAEMRQLFGTDGVRGEFGKFPMDLETVSKLGKSVGKLFSGKKCIIGRDTRESGLEIEKVLIGSLITQGIDVYLIGVVPTPTLAWLIKELGMDFGVMVSASHNPYQDNGLKFFDCKGFKLNEEVEQTVENIFFSDEYNYPSEEGDVFEINGKCSFYTDHVKKGGCNLSGFKIVLDCANGAASILAPKIFLDLGAEVITLNNQPDGVNINHCCGAVYPGLLREKVLENKADLGICLDGDADRLILLDELGNVLDGDFILAIVGSYLKEKGKLKNNLVVGTVMSNLGLVKCFEEQNIDFVKTKVGDKYVVEEMLKKKAILGGEQAGHIILLDHNSSGDGIIAALQILKIIKTTDKKLSHLSKIMYKFPQVLFNLEVKEKKKIEEIGELSYKIKEIEKKLGDGGRVLVRYSGTQNLLRIMLEGKDKELITVYAHELIGEVKKEIGV